MPLYEYEARNISGNILKGKVYSESENDVNLILNEAELYPIKILPFSKKSVNGLRLINGITLSELSLMCKQIYVILSSGISILNAIQIVNKQVLNYKLKRALDNAFSEIQQGRTLTEALNVQKIFPQMFTSLIHVGEMSGKLDIMMKKLSEYYNREYKLKQKITQSLIYPLFVSVFALLSITFLITKVLPSFMTIYKQFNRVDIPFPTRIILHISNYINIKSVIFTAIFILAIIYFLRIKSLHCIDRFKLNFKVYKNIVIINFASMLCIMIDSGISISESLHICFASTKNSYVKCEIQEIINNVNKGYELSEAFDDTSLFSDLLVDMIKIGEKSGNLDVLLQGVIDYYDIELENKLTNLTSMIEPIIIIALSFVIGFIVLAILMPLLQIYEFMI